MDLKMDKRQLTDPGIWNIFQCFESFASRIQCVYDLTGSALSAIFFTDSEVFYAIIPEAEELTSVFQF